MRQIFPERDGASEALGGADLADLAALADPADPASRTSELVAALGEIYAYPAGRWVRANMIASVDGAIAVEGRSGPLSGVADKLVFAVLRSLADVIVVGARTVRAERYR